VIAAELQQGDFDVTQFEIETILEQE